MKQYLEILEEILEKGTWKAPAREGLPKTLSRFSIEKRFDLQEGFPLLTTKKMYWKGVLHEMLWFLQGSTNIKYLVDNNCNIWNQDAYKYYLKVYDAHHSNRSLGLSFENFVQCIKDKSLEHVIHYNNYTLGDLGKVYGYQWRNWQDSLDQIQKLIEGLKKNPESRYHVVTAWNPSEIYTTALPSCHMMFQMNCRKLTHKERVHLLIISNAPEYVIEGELVDEANVPQYFLDCKMIQRSCDTFLGVPFNIASYAFLTHIIAKLVNMVPGEFIWSGNDVHVYDNHIEQINEQLSRTPMLLPELKINSNWNSIDDIKFEDFEIINYNFHPAIKGDLSVGV